MKLNFLNLFRLTIFSFVLLLGGVEHASAADPDPVATAVIDIEQQAGQWVYGKRKGDVLALPVDANGNVLADKDKLKLYFRERKVGVKSQVDASSGVDLKSIYNVESGVGKSSAYDRGTMLAVSRYRELPLDQIGGPIDLTNVRADLNPKNKDGFSFYFMPLGRSGAHRLVAGSGVQLEKLDDPARGVDDVALYYPQDMPWDLTRPGTLMHYASQKVQEPVNLNQPQSTGVVYIQISNGGNPLVSYGGEFKRAYERNKTLLSDMKNQVLAFPYKIPDVEQLMLAAMVTGDEPLEVEYEKLNNQIKAIEQAAPNFDEMNFGIIANPVQAGRFQRDRLAKQIWYVAESLGPLLSQEFVVKRTGGLVLDLRALVGHQGLIIEPNPGDIVEETITKIQEALNRNIDYDQRWGLAGSPSYKKMLEMGVYHPPLGFAIERKNLLVAYHGDGNTPLIVKKGSVLSGPLQIVSDEPVILVGNMGTMGANENPVVREKMQELYRWMANAEDARWRIIAPTFQVGSPASLKQIEEGSYGPLGGPQAQPDPYFIEAQIAQLMQLKANKTEYLAFLQALRQELMDGGFTSINDAIAKRDQILAIAADQRTPAQIDTLAKAQILIIKTVDGPPPTYPPSFSGMTTNDLQTEIQETEQEIANLDQQIADLKAQLAALQP